MYQLIPKIPLKKSPKNKNKKIIIYFLWKLMSHFTICMPFFFLLVFQFNYPKSKAKRLIINSRESLCYIECTMHNPQEPHKL